MSNPKKTVMANVPLSYSELEHLYQGLKVLAMNVEFMKVSVLMSITAADEDIELEYDLEALAEKIETSKSLMAMRLGLTKNKIQ